MKIKPAAIATVLSVGIAGCSTTPVSADKAKPVPSDRLYAFQAQSNEGLGTLVVTRDAGALGSACNIVLSFDGQKAAAIGASETASFHMHPGEKVAEIAADGCGVAPREREVIVKAGESRRYRISAEMGMGYTLTRTNH